MDELPMWHDIFDCDSATGVLRWKLRPGNGNQVKCGDIAGCDAGKGYLQVIYKSKTRMVHRVIYEMVHGNIPQGKEIDHKNRHRSDNRITNLRLATKQENSRNGSMRPNNTSGFVGVSWDKHASKWKAQLVVAGRCLHLGLFTSKLDAYAARLAAEKLHHGEFAQSLVTEGVSDG